VKWIRQVHEGPAIPYRQIIQKTVAESGWRGFFSGSLAAVYRNVPHRTLAYTLYPKAEHLVFQLQGMQQPIGGGEAGSGQRVPPQSVSFTTRFWAGYMTLFGTTLITHPLDTLRVRLSVHAKSAELGYTAAGRRLLAEEGVRAFYRGFGATMVGAGPRGALGFGVSETLKPALAKVRFFTEEGAGGVGLGRFLCGYAAGVVSEFFIYPLDTIRRRQQALGDATSIGRANVVRALSHIWRTEGVRGMFKGISLNLLKNPMATAVSFLVNDAVKDSLGYVGHNNGDGGGPRGH